jgi:hypothetical protein
MTIQAFTGCAPIYLPTPPQIGAAAPAFATAGTIDANTEKHAFVFQVPKTGTLDKAEFRLGAVTFGGSSALRVSFQDVSATDGNPDGTQDQYRDMTSLSANAWNAPGLMTADGTDGGAKRSVTKGDILSLVMEYQTFTAADSIIFSGISTGSVIESPLNFPYCDLFTASWAKTHMLPTFALKYDDGAYHAPPCCMPISALNSTAFASNSTPDERGLLFQLPFPASLEGIYFRSDLDNDGELVIYNSAHSAQRTVSLDKDIRSSAGGQWFTRIFSSPLDLSANTDYRAVIKPTTTSNLSTYDWDSAVSLANYIGGSTWQYTERTDAGAWTDTATKRPWMGLILSGFDGGGGGGAVDPMRTSIP